MRRKNIHLAMLFIGAGIVSDTILSLMTNQYGIGISPDSVNYLAAAFELANGSIMLGYDGQPFVQWPPLFPVLLASLSLLGFDPVDVMPHVQALFLAATAVVSAHCVHRVSRSWALAISIGLAVLVSPPLVKTASYLWSEPGFTFFMLCAVTSTVYYLRSPRISSLIFLSIFCALAFFQRYAGLCIVLSAGVSILLFDRRSSKERLGAIIILVTISCTPIAAWMARNFIISGALTGERHISVGFLNRALVDSFYELGAWFSPTRLGIDLSIVVGPSIMMLSISVLVFSFWRGRDKCFIELAVMSIFMVIYFIFIVYTQLIACCTARFMAPLYPVTIVFVVCIFARVVYYFHRYGRNAQRILFGVSALGVAIILAMNGNRTSAEIINFSEQGGGYNSKIWQKNSLIAELDRNEIDKNECVISNAPDAIYYLARIRCVRFGPRKGRWYHESATLDDERPRFLQSVEAMSAPAIFVWFPRARPGQYFAPESLGEDIAVEVLFRTDDGVVYEIGGKDERP